MSIRCVEAAVLPTVSWTLEPPPTPLGVVYFRRVPAWRYPFFQVWPLRLATMHAYFVSIHDFFSPTPMARISRRLHKKHGCASISRLQQAPMQTLLWKPFCLSLASFSSTPYKRLRAGVCSSWLASLTPETAEVSRQFATLELTQPFSSFCKMRVNHT